MPRFRDTSVQAHAKVNLDLRVLYRRPDGFHEIRTIFQTVSLADVLAVRYAASRETTISIDGNIEIADNLIARAARLCLEEMDTTAHVEFTLAKRIPMGAGLGGGSSDAAAVLLTLPVLAGRVIPIGRLMALAAQLGSDVPFFLFGGAAVGVGRGEELYPLPDLPRRAGLVLAPAVHVATAEAYGALSPTLTPQSVAQKLAEFQLTTRQPLNSLCRNDFESVVLARHPAIARAKAALVDCGAECALMTGSGAAVFGIFNSIEMVQRVVQSLSGENAYPVSLLSGASYRSLWLRRLKPHIEGKLWPPRSRYAR